jgi:lantibiotic biosynthesis protein
MKAETAWRPILEGDLAQRAQETIAAVAEELPHAVSISAPEAPDPSLATGDAGPAIFHAYLARTRPGSGHARLASAHLARAGATLADVPLPPALHEGFTGVAWALQHLQPPEPAAEDPLAGIDEALLEHLSQSPWQGDYDLISGLAGFGVYAAERLPRPAAGLLLERLLDRLEETAERRPEGLTWRTDPELLPDWQRQLCPNGYYNLGLAHGVPGVIGLLGLMCQAGVLVQRARPLLEQAVAWLLAQRLPGVEDASYARWLGADGPGDPARSAWCYGDPGVAAALLLAARAIGEPDWERQSVALALAAAHRPRERAGVVDAGLCHGAAGLAHIFNRMAQATGDERLAEAARVWFQRTLEFRQDGQGIGGFLAWAPEADGTPAWKADPGLLTGAAGIALALLAASYPHEPQWDRVLLVSAPPRG